MSAADRFPDFPRHEPVDVSAEMREAAEPPPERITRPGNAAAVTAEPDRTPQPDRLTRPGNAAAVERIAKSVSAPADDG